MRHRDVLTLNCIQISCSSLLEVEGSLFCGQLHDALKTDGSVVGAIAQWAGILLCTQQSKTQPGSIPAPYMFPRAH